MLLPAAAWAAPEAVTLRAAVGNRLSFEVAAPLLALETVGDEPGLTRLVMTGYQATGEIGAPGVPSRVVTVALPPTGDVQVSASGLEPEVHENLLLAPVPVVYREPGKDGAEGERFTRKPETYTARAAVNGPRAKLLGVAWLRNQRIAEIAILPADYDPAARHLTLWRRVDVEVTMSGAAPAGPPAERQDPFEHLYRSVLVNYEQGRAWRRPAGQVVSRREARAGMRAVAQGIPGSSVFVGHSWLKLQIPQTGFYKLDYGTARTTRLFQNATVPFDSLRLFTWPGYPVLPEASYCDSCDYQEVPFSTSGVDSIFGGVGNTSNSDAIYFFAMGPSDWANLYDPSWRDTSFIEHPYDTHNFYYLTYGTSLEPVGGTPARIPTRAADTDTASAGLSLTEVPARAHFEVSTDFHGDSSPLVFSTANGSGTVDSLVWQKWFWLSIGPGQARQANFDLPGADTNQTVRVKIRLWGLSTGPHGEFTVNHADPTLNGILLPRVNWIMKDQATIDTTLAAPRSVGNTLALASPLTFDNTTSEIGLAWIEARYSQRLAASNDTIAFDTPATGQRTAYHVSGFVAATPPHLFDVTDSYHPVEIMGAIFDATNHRLGFVDDGTRLRRYRIVPDAGFTRLLGPSLAMASDSSLTNLRQLGADYLVVYFDDFAAAADTLVSWRSDHLPLLGVPPPYVAKKVPVSALYDQFSGGRTDPLAIRNFLRAVYYGGDTTHTAGRRLAFVTFLGDASFDFKDILGGAGPGQPGCLLPTYENGYDATVFGGRRFSTDDWLLNVNDANVTLPDFFGGRLPVDDEATAMDVVRNKVLLYERNLPLGEWRNKVMLIADDNVQCQLADPLQWSHVKQTADLDTVSIPPHMDRKYVFLHTYPTTGTCSKPGARADIQSTIASGVMLVNFIGHGSPFQIADEQVMVQTDASSFTNGPRYFAFLAASCDVGLFDDPTLASLGERLMTTAGGGAIGVISATQLAFSQNNVELNRIVYNTLFTRDSLTGDQYHATLSEALLEGKLKAVLAGHLGNNVKYNLLGDAATRLALPQLWVELATQDSFGSPLANLPRGYQVKFTGRVVSTPGGPLVPIDGRASLLIEDSAPYLNVPDGTPGFYFTAGPEFRGDVEIHGGLLSGAFVLPLEARQGARGRLRAYVSGRAPGALVDGDGVGALRSQIITGVSSSNDNSGPQITLTFPGGATSVRPDAVLNIGLADPSGILTTDHIPQNGIIVTVDDNTTTRADVTASFRYATGSFTQGAATFTLPGLALGAHTIKVSAADNLASGLNAAAHRSSAAISFTVAEAPTLQVARAYLFPDPACSRCGARGGRFVISVPGDPVNVQLKLFTVSGRMIRTLTAFGGVGSVELPWDGLDDEGQPLANGVYLFKVNVNVRNADGTSSSQGSAHADGRFVIVNR